MIPQYRGMIGRYRGMVDRGMIPRYRGMIGTPVSKPASPGRAKPAQMAPTAEPTSAAERAVAGGARRFRRYSDYRASGVEWLGEIPNHWERKRLKNNVTRLESGGTPESGNLRFWTDDERGIPWVAISDMTREFRLRKTDKRITEEGRASKRLRLLPVGTLLYSMYASLGKVALLETEATINQAILGVVLRTRDVYRDYLRWWFEFMQRHIPMLSSSNTQDNLSAERVRNMPLVLPPDVMEQRAIAGFLDRETARIDALVAKKERLIELLQEKRTALITRAVTRGLAPNAPTKDSGIPWLGKIPAHWGVDRLKYIATLNDDALSETTDAEFEMVYVDIGSVDAMVGIAEKEMLRFGNAPSRARRIVQNGDVIVSTVRTYLRAIAVIERAEHNLIVSTGFAVIRPRRVESSFAAYALRAPYFVERVVANSVGVSYPAINAIELTGFEIAYPEADEQRAIAVYLDGKTSQADALIAKVRQAIAHLTEYRTALISAAVTGKIDVRAEAA